MALDPNIILQAGQGVQQTNPLAMAGQALGVQNAMIVNQGNAQMLRARQVIGPIYQQSIDPTTGQLDTNKFLSMASQNPDTAYMAGDLAKAAQDRQEQQIKIQSDQYDLLKKHIAGLQQGLISLYANPNITQADVLRYAGQKVAEGTISPQEMSQVLGTMPGDQAQLRPWLLNQYGQLLDTDKQVDLYYGKPQQTDTGAQIQQGTESAVTGYHPQGAFTKGLSPAEAAGTVATVGPNGQPGVISKGQYAAQSGIGQGGDYIPANGQPMDVQVASQRVPAAPQPPAGVRGAFMATGLAPGQEDAMKDSAAQGQAALKASSDYRTNVRPLLEEVGNELQQGILTGPNAHGGKLLGQFAAQLGINTANTPRVEVADKVLEMLAQRNLSALSGPGVPTDAKLASAQNASPSTKLSNAGLQETLATVKGTGQAVDLLGQAYDAYLKANPTSPVPFNQFKVQFAKDIDPYVLVLRSMPHSAMLDALNAMKPKERADITAASNRLDKLAQAIGWQP